jgi:hypothetical protein
MDVENNEVEEQQIDAGQAAMDEESALEIGYEADDNSSAIESLDTDGDTEDQPPTNQDENLGEESQAKVDDQKPDDEKNPAETGDDAFMKKFENLIDGRLRNYTGHINKVMDQKLEGLQTKATEAAKEVAKEAGGDLPSNNRIQAALKDSKAMQRLEDDFPEYAEALREAQSIGATELKAEIMEDVKKLGGNAVDTSGFVKSDDIADLKETIVTMTHPTWISDIQSPEFSSWINGLEGEPKNQANLLAASERPADASAMMKMYYDSKPSPKPEPVSRSNPKKRLEAAAAPTGSSGLRPTRQVMDEDDAMAHGYENG